MPFETVASILSTSCSEVLINLDSDGIARIRRAADGANSDALLTAIFGDESWRAALDASDFKGLCKQVLDLYKTKLRSIPSVEYAFSFEMRGRHDAINYHLVFASQNALGLEKMKEAMRSIDQNGSYCFSDGAVGQHTLFRFDHPEDFAPKFHLKFVGREVGYDQLRDYALNETPFTNPKSMLADLERQGLLLVKSNDPKRRKGAFKEESLISLTFVEKKPGSMTPFWRAVRWPLSQASNGPK